MNDRELLELAAKAAGMLQRREIDRLREAVAAEREACAKVCDDEATIEGIAQRCAAAIRARGEK